MNAVQRLLYAQRNRRRLQIFENEYAKQLFPVLFTEMRIASDILKERGIEALRMHVDSMVMINGLAPIIQNIYRTVGLYYANKTMREIIASAKRPEAKAGFGFDAAWIAEILEYFQLYLLNKAVLPITTSVRNTILEILTKGVQEGWGIDRMAFEIRNSQMPVWRARAIARTEILKAQLEGQKIGARDSEWETVKTWISAHDSRTRHSHRDVDATKLPDAERFKVPIYRGELIIGYDNMLGPGDPAATAGNVINCRCTLSYRAARDKNGRLIKKINRNSRIAVILPNQRRQPTQVVTI